MKLSAQVRNEIYQIQIEQKGERLSIQIDDRCHEALVCESDRGNYVFIQDGSVFECLVQRHQTLSDSSVVQVRNRTFVISIADPKRLGSAHGSSANSAEATAQISSPMAGKVVRVLVKKGEIVKAGDRILVVEAMKMQNELKSPIDGVVNELRANEGSTVNAGEVLAMIGTDLP